MGRALSAYNFSSLLDEDVYRTSKESKRVGHSILDVCKCTVETPHWPSTSLTHREPFRAERNMDYIRVGLGRVRPGRSPWSSDRRSLEAVALRASVFIFSRRY